MPELPEVQTTVNGLQEHIVGLRITAVWSDYNSPYFKGSETIKDPTYFRRIKKELVGMYVIASTRRAKNILIHLNKKNLGGAHVSSADEKILLVHMKMTGHLLYGTSIPQRKKIRGNPSGQIHSRIHSTNMFILF
jgi:formamidopyrimidine-DNA glycosylase